MSESPTLATKEGTEALAQGLDLMVGVHQEFSNQDALTLEQEQQFTQNLFSPNEIAALLTLAVRRLAVKS